MCGTSHCGEEDILGSFGLGPVVGIHSRPEEDRKG